MIIEVTDEQFLAAAKKIVAVLKDDGIDGGGDVAIALIWLGITSLCDAGIAREQLDAMTKDLTRMAFNKLEAGSN